MTKIVFFFLFYYGVHYSVTSSWWISLSIEQYYWKWQPQEDVTRSRDGWQYGNPLAIRAPSICNIDHLDFYHNSRLHNEMWFLGLLRQSSCSHSDHGTEHNIFHSHCSGRCPRSRRSRWMERVLLREVVEQEKEERIRPSWWWRSLASPFSPRT